jgi:hypothetical protein
MKEKKIIEVNLGVGTDQLFPKPIQIIIENEVEQIAEEDLRSTEGSDELNNLNKKENGKKNKRTPKKSS